MASKYAEAARNHRTSTGTLSLMIGPTGAGKSTWLASGSAKEYGIHPQHVVSSDQIRQDICGDFKDISRDAEVWDALHAIVDVRLRHGLPVVVDSTNLRKEHRLRLVALAQGGPVRYFVVNRRVEDIRRDGGWRNQLPFDLIGKHQVTFTEEMDSIAKMDGIANTRKEIVAINL